MITPTTPLAEDGIGSRTVSGFDTIRGYDRPFARVSWGAIFAGTIFALATQIVLTLLGLSIGLATIDPASGDTPSGTTLGMGAGIWMLISTIISLFLGGYIAGRLGGTFNGWIHGLITWAACTVLTVILLTSAVGRLMGAASGLTRFVAQNAPQAAQMQLPPQLQQPLNQLQGQAQQPVQPPSQQQVERAADEAAGTTSAGSFWAALTLILGAAAAAFGGKAGRQYPRHESHHVHEHRTSTATVTPKRS